MKDGAPFEHPIMGENLRNAYPEIDVNHLPSQFARFERIEKPALGVYDKGVSVSYVVCSDGVVRDHWTIDPMTEQEKLDKQNEVKTAWKNRYPSWTFSDELCKFVPPIPYPDDGKFYFWDESQLNWVEVV